MVLYTRLLIIKIPTKALRYDWAVITPLFHLSRLKKKKQLHRARELTTEIAGSEFYR